MKPFAADAPIFLRDFGVPFQRGTTAFMAIFDTPDDFIEIAGMSAQSRAYEITYSAQDVVLKVADKVTHNGHTYDVRQPPSALADGVFFSAILTRA